MKKIILIMGLPGSGKTTLANSLKILIKKTNSVDWFNADQVRKIANDWDFSNEGRKRQMLRMSLLAQCSKKDFVICDFVAPLENIRKEFNADFTVWVNTLEKSRFEDTNNIFEKPKKFDVEVTEQNSEKLSKIIFDKLMKGN